VPGGPDALGGGLDSHGQPPSMGNLGRKNTARRPGRQPAARTVVFR
jgi:hypothetical protein